MAHGNLLSIYSGIASLVFPLGFFFFPNSRNYIFGTAFQMPSREVPQSVSLRPSTATHAGVATFSPCSFLHDPSVQCGTSFLGRAVCSSDDATSACLLSLHFKRWQQRCPDTDLGFASLFSVYLALLSGAITNTLSSFQTSSGSCFCDESI